MKKVFSAKSETETINLGKEFAKQWLGKPKKSQKNGALVVSLVGDLGSGKTSFAKGVAKGLGVKERVSSPTFVIMRNYAISKKNNVAEYEKLYHIDAYRLSGAADLEILGFGAVAADSRNIVLVEWGDAVKEGLPKRAPRLFFEVAAKQSRKITAVAKKDFFGAKQ